MVSGSARLRLLLRCEVGQVRSRKASAVDTERLAVLCCATAMNSLFQVYDHSGHGGGLTKRQRQQKQADALSFFL